MAETTLGGPPAVPPELLRAGSLRIEGSPLDPIIAGFCDELQRARVRHPQPHFYLADEWGVIFDDERPGPSSRSIAIPFYLARPELTDLHRRHGYEVEPANLDEVVRYLRHEMGHVINYAYRLHTEPDWKRHFGNFGDPYEEEYKFDSSSRDFVQHLGRDRGWHYAQKHPDDDWAETFAVWMTPGLAWRAEYKDWRLALAKLESCARVMAGLASRPVPETTVVDDGDVITSVPPGWYADA
jgi:hypothetical protein